MSKRRGWWWRWRRPPYAVIAEPVAHRRVVDLAEVVRQEFPAANIWTGAIHLPHIIVFLTKCRFVLLLLARRQENTCRGAY